MAYLEFKEPAGRLGVSHHFNISDYELNLPSTLIQGVVDLFEGGWEGYYIRTAIKEGFLEQYRDFGLQNDFGFAVEVYWDNPQPGALPIRLTRYVRIFENENWINLFQLKQEIPVGGIDLIRGGVVINMTLTNVSNKTTSEVELGRAFNINIKATPANDYIAQNGRSVFVWEPSSGSEMGRGLMLSHLAYLTSSRDADKPKPIPKAFLGNAMAYTTPSDQGPVKADHDGGLSYSIGAMAPQDSFSVSVLYRQF